MKNASWRRIVGLCLFASCAVCLVAPAGGQITDWTGASDTNFFNDANWTNSAPDTINEYGYIDSTNVNQVAIIDAGAGTVTLDGVNLGEFSGGGNVIQNGGTLNFDAFTETKIGGDGPNSSSWIMTGDAVLLYDGPLDGGGGGYGLDGVNGSDFDVGNGASPATLELHDNAILRISDDLKISDNGVPAGGDVLLDGNAQITVGSGTPLCSNGPGTLTIAGDALYVSGNSAGPGNSAQGYTNEGYLAFSEGAVVVKDNGRFWIRTLQTRDAESSITVQDNARFDIFDVFYHDAPDLGNATVGSAAGASVNGSERTSEISEGPGSKMALTVKDNGVMTVDVDIPDSPWSGLALSGGTNRGGNGGGGETLIEVRDQGSFTVQQDLHMTMGTDVDAKATLKIRGPDATVAVNGDVRMAVTFDDLDNPGSATLHEVITAATQSTLNVGGDINIDHGDLIIELDGYSPIGGESYELISAGSITGAAFKSEDFSLAPLADELSWEVVVSGTSVLLNVLGSAGVPGDLDGDGDVDGADFLAIQRGFGDSTDANDFAAWEANFGTGAAAAAAAVPEPAALTTAVLLAICLGGARRRAG